MATVLVVDDETDLADTCARSLKRAGFECQVAYSVRDALSMFDQNRPSLVLSDITLPDGDGFDIARHARQKSPDTPIILMTAYHSADAPEEARRAGANRYLRKPFSIAEMISIVRELVDHEGPSGSAPKTR